MCVCVCVCVSTQVDLGESGNHRRSLGAGSLFTVLRNVVKEHGYSGLYAGLAPRVAKIAPACAIMIGSYEYGKEYFLEYNTTQLNETKSIGRQAYSSNQLTICYNNCFQSHDNYTGIINVSTGTMLVVRQTATSWAGDQKGKLCMWQKMDQIPNEQCCCLIMISFTHIQPWNYTPILKTSNWALWCLNLI